MQNQLGCSVEDNGVVNGLVIMGKITRKESDISVKRVWVIQQANIRQIVAGTRRPVIFWNKKTIQSLRLERKRQNVGGNSNRLGWWGQAVLEQSNPKDNREERGGW